MTQFGDIKFFFFFQNEDIPSFGASDPQYILGVDILSHGLSIWVGYLEVTIL